MTVVAAATVAVLECLSFHTHAASSKGAKHVSNATANAIAVPVSITKFRRGDEVAEGTPSACWGPE